MELQNKGDRDKVRPGPIGVVGTNTVTQVKRSGTNFLPLGEMGTSDGSGPIGQREGPDEYKHLVMRRLFSKYYASPNNSNSFPSS